MPFPISSIGSGDNAVHFSENGLWYDTIRSRDGVISRDNEFDDGMVEHEVLANRVPTIEISGSLSLKDIKSRGQLAFTTLLDNLRPLRGTIQVVTFLDSPYYKASPANYNVEGIEITHTMEGFSFVTNWRVILTYESEITDTE